MKGSLLKLLTTGKGQPKALILAKNAADKKIIINKIAAL